MPRHVSKPLFVGLKIDEIKMFKDTVYIYWSHPEVGNGRYEIERIQDGRWIGKSEGIDLGKGKKFLNRLLKIFANQVKVIQ